MPTNTIALDPLQQPVQQVYNRTAPCEPPKALRLLCDFSKAGTYTVNGQNAVSQNRLCDVQTVYIDASGTDQATILTVPATGQIVQVKGRTQGWYPVACPNPWNLTIANADGAVNMVVLLANVPVQASSWATQ